MTTNVAPPLERRAELERAVRLLEAPRFAVRLADYAGKPLAQVLRLVPRADAAFRQVVRDAILRGLELAVDSLEEEVHPPSSWLPKAMTGLTGGIGGLFGLAALPFELPLTTTLMLRSIADIARHYGEDMTRMDARLACLEVFALGGRGTDAKTDVGYYAARAMFSRLSTELASYVVERGAIEASVPVVSRVVSQIVSSFGLAVSERAAASAIPVLGAVGGATVNVVFMDHFEKLAHGHFALRRLEREFGPEEVGRWFEEVRRRGSKSAARPLDLARDYSPSRPKEVNR
jgi:hypothetical protein